MQNKSNNLIVWAIVILCIVISMVSCSNDKGMVTQARERTQSIIEKNTVMAKVHVVPTEEALKQAPNMLPVYEIKRIHRMYVTGDVLLLDNKYYQVDSIDRK